jgi:carbonic anhydrase
MKRKLFLLILFVSLMKINIAFSNKDEETPESKMSRAVAMLVNMAQDNADFMRSHEASYFAGFMKGQSPRTTCVTCVDSRAHIQAFDKTPDNDIFKVSNLSAQYESSKSSIKYGVWHLHTPLLIIIGHDDCGAVKARTTLDERLEGVHDADLQRDLTPVHVLNSAKDTTPGFDSIVHRNILYNIHKQVGACLDAKHAPISHASPPSSQKEQSFEGAETQKSQQTEGSDETPKLSTTSAETSEMPNFKELVRQRKLIIVGALYDFANKQGLGQGKLSIINVRDHENCDLPSSVSNQGPMPDGLKEFIVHQDIVKAVDRLKLKIMQAQTL